MRAKDEGFDFKTDLSRIQPRREPKEGKEVDQTLLTDLEAQLVALKVRFKVPVISRKKELTGFFGIAGSLNRLNSPSPPLFPPPQTSRPSSNPFRPFNSLLDPFPILD